MGIAGPARLTDVHTGATLATIQHQTRVLAASISPDGSKLATGSYERTARLTDTHTGATLATIQHQGRVYAASFSPDDNYLLRPRFVLCGLPQKSITKKALGICDILAAVRRLLYGDGQKISLDD